MHRETSQSMSFPKPPPIAQYKKDPSILKTLDSRISFDKEANQWILTDTTGEYQFNNILEKWIKIGKHVLNDEEIEEEANKEEIKRIKKQKLEEIKNRINEFKNRNTSVFITGLPNDITEEEMVEIFGKYGTILKDKTGDSRVKLYYNDKGVFKNEGLVIFENQSSVSLSIQMLDGTEIKGSKVKIEPADFKQQKDSAKAKIFSKIVVIENMFRKEELNEDLKKDIEEDLYQECSKHKIEDILKIAFFENDKVITIKFKSVDSMEKVLKTFNDRFYDGLKLKVAKFNGEKYT
ncbi:hypothetical protein CLIB1444_22S00694 [[Candida] jaroonii]|uniref:Uncharacterized protein n=1 Tax=[Candida] jaroonii TaxID=467808 RepID=A0ACA9YGM1_9ASCO|nr:hypothetical protein CLIB1444_22S00694 [[Candida] jaroonii]